MPSLKIDIAPAVLIWARQSIGMSEAQAAKKVGVGTVDLMMWEAGADDPTLTQLRKMADAYQRSLAVFFLAEPPDDTDRLPDFRLLPATRGKAWSPELHAAFRRAHMQRDAMVELERQSDAPVMAEAMRLTLDHDPEAAGALVRRWFGAAADLPALGTPSGTLRRWVRGAENRDVLVTQVPGVRLEEMRGFSLSEQPFPVVAINGKDSPRGKLFTLLHETAHILLRSGGLCDLEDEQGSAGTQAERVEQFCNRVAAAALMPRSEVLQDERVARASPSSGWSNADLTAVARRFGVSDEAMLLRLVTLGRASASHYRQRRHLFLWRYAQRQALAARRTGGGPDPGAMKVRDLGRRYVAAVLDAYHRRDITASDLADYLEVKLNRITQMEAVLEADR